MGRKELNDMSNLTNNYRKYIAAAAAICLAMSAAGCSKSDSSSETDAKTASAQISSEAFEISAEDKDIGYDKTEAVKIALSGESAEIEGVKIAQFSPFRPLF